MIIITYQYILLQYSKQFNHHISISKSGFTFELWDIYNFSTNATYNNKEYFNFKAKEIGYFFGEHAGVTNVSLKASSNIKISNYNIPISVYSMLNPEASHVNMQVSLTLFFL